MSSENIYFNPTCLMIKQHQITGKLYLCKSTKPKIATSSYKGSGSYWLNHIKKHGKEHVVTIWYCWFYEKDTLVDCALMMSEMYDVVKSNVWANCKPENGLDGNPKNVCTVYDITKQKCVNVEKTKIIKDIHVSPIKDKLTVRDINGNYLKITREEYLQNKEKYFTVNSERISAIVISTGEFKFISKDEFYLNPDKFRFVSTGMVNAFNLLEKISIRISKDEFYSNREKYITAQQARKLNLY